MNFNCVASKDYDKMFPQKSQSVGRFSAKQVLKDVETSRFSYFGSTTSGRARHQRKPVFDYVPWSLLDR